METELRVILQNIKDQLDPREFIDSWVSFEEQGIFFYYDDKEYCLKLEEM